ncbi:diguanylate cyclase [Fundidesulfovibrio terrae]|uniref:diguanylate cyclase n=1 Tax=Fundidesulfovibrio terrae TaxID=2922866 RepID=UPI001FB01685|nr:diguanylate cyclase [Fundidesulfovibrio terrae]
MDHPLPLFDKEQQVVESARQALAAAPQALAEPFGELLREYESLMERSRRVAEMALSVQMDLDAALAQVSQLSQVDGLTGALNSRSFELLLSRDWAQAQREGTALSLVMVNVDNFRAYNDIYGSLKGDDCLKAVTQVLLRCLYREVDVVARLEGDTFAALLPGTDAKGALVVAERIASETAALEIPHLESPHGGVVTVSVGLAAVTPTRAEAPMVLVRRAQAALGLAKDSGRNAVFLDSGDQYSEAG